jgi:catalase
VQVLKPEQLGGFDFDALDPIKIWTRIAMVTFCLQRVILVLRLETAPHKGHQMI